jgi:hypothetical protein
MAEDGVFSCFPSNDIREDRRKKGQRESKANTNKHKNNSSHYGYETVESLIQITVVD